MRIAIVGAGGVGGLIGGLLARAGHEVAFVARGTHLEAMRREGLHVDSPRGTFRIHPVQASEDPAALGGPAEAVLVCVKSWQVGPLAPRLAPLVGPSTVVAPLENGVGAADALARALGEGPVVGGLCFLLSTLEAPGRVRHTGPALRVTLGERRGGSSERVERLLGVLRQAGVDAEASPDVEAAVWQKFLFIETFGAVGAITRAPIGVMRSLPGTRAVLTAALEELAALARARGVRLAPDAVQVALGWMDALPAQGTASMQRDIQAGRPSELHDQTGEAVRMAREAGVPAPLHAWLYACLLPQENAARAPASPPG